MIRKIFNYAIPALAALAIVPTYAAIPVDLMEQPIAMTSLLASPASQMTFVEKSRSLDVKKTLHVRIQQTYAGYPVWGADAVVHIPNGSNTSHAMNAVFSNARSMNGMVYQNLAADLANTPATTLTSAQADAALQHAIADYQQKAGNAVISKSKSQLMVYIDENNKAHWVYKVNFHVAPAKSGALPEMPVYIIDAITSKIYENWNDLKTEDALGGGFGGNKKMGKLVYDGLANNLAKLNITYDAKQQKCFMQNSEVTVTSEKSNKVISFPCKATNPDHDNVYWDGARDKVNGGYSPANDALFGGAVIKRLYKDWYNVEVLTNDDGTPMMLNMVVHSDMDNAYWDGYEMVFGDGIDMFYPLTSLGVAAHEISHGFTEQHSNLNYDKQSGGMNEAFSDMAAQAAEFYAYGKNSWQIGPEIFKAENEALRYMDQPSKDCKGDKPGHSCSIDDATQYRNGLDVHYSSGVYNRFFYTLATTQGWDTRKAFDVMVAANENYWTSTGGYMKAACGVISAANDLGYDVAAVRAAFDVVKVNYQKCASVAIPQK